MSSWATDFRSLGDFGSLSPFGPRSLTGGGFLFGLFGLLGQVRLKLLAVDFAILVGVDFIEMLGKRSSSQLLPSQAAVGVQVQRIKIQRGLRIGLAARLDAGRNQP